MKLNPLTDGPAIITLPGDPASRSLDIVRRLSSGELRRDPDRRPYVPPVERTGPVWQPPAAIVPGAQLSGTIRNIGLRARLVALITRQPGLTGVEMAERLGVLKPVVHATLYHLHADGLVTRTGRPARYTIA